MKTLLVRWLLGLLVTTAVVSAALWWRRNFTGNAMGQILGWPALELARSGLRHTWPVVPLLLLGLPAMNAILFRRRHLLASVSATALMVAVFCGVGAGWTTRLAGTVPLTVPYPADSPEARAYVEAYGLSYVYSLTGSFVTRCFSPEADTRGHYQGQEDGGTVWNRALGWPENRGQDLIRRSAAIDGVSPALLDP